jgi:XTP/dITP diphosphohydrolase
MSAEEKDLVSHRGKSLRAIAPDVIQMLASLG